MVFKQLVVNFKTGFIKFGFLHMVATNLCVWAITVVQEGAESYAHYNDKTLKIRMSLTKHQTTVQGHSHTIQRQGNSFYIWLGSGSISAKFINFPFLRHRNDVNNVGNT